MPVPYPDEFQDKPTPLWPVQNLCPTCACKRFEVFSRREGGKTVVMRLVCTDCAAEFDTRR